MNGLKNHNGRYCESDYENAFIASPFWRQRAGNILLGTA